MCVWWCHWSIVERTPAKIKIYEHSWHQRPDIILFSGSEHLLQTSVNQRTDAVRKQNLETRIFIVISLPTNCRCRGFMWHLLTHMEHAYTVGLPLDDLWARRRDLYQIMHNNQKIHATGGIRTCNPRKRSGTDPRLGPCGQRNRPNCEISTCQKRGSRERLTFRHGASCI